VRRDVEPEAPPIEIENFGNKYLPNGNGKESFSIGGEECTREQARQRMLQGALADDRAKLRLTVIGSETARAPVLADLSGALADVANPFLVQAYPADHWAVARAGFVTSGSPTIYVQDATGKVLHRQDDYADGAEGLRKALEAIRKPDPNYQPARDSDRRGGLAGSSLWIVLAVAAGFLLGQRRETQ